MGYFEFVFTGSDQKVRERAAKEARFYRHDVLGGSRGEAKPELIWLERSEIGPNG